VRVRNFISCSYKDLVFLQQNLRNVTTGTYTEELAKKTNGVFELGLRTSRSQGGASFDGYSFCVCMLPMQPAPRFRFWLLAHLYHFVISRRDGRLRQRSLQPVHQRTSVWFKKQMYTVHTRIWMQSGNLVWVIGRRKKSLHHLVPTTFQVYQIKGLLTFPSKHLIQKWFLQAQPTSHVGLVTRKRPVSTNITLGLRF